MDAKKSCEFLRICFQKHLHTFVHLPPSGNSISPIEDVEAFLEDFAALDFVVYRIALGTETTLRDFYQMMTDTPDKQVQKSSDRGEDGQPAEQIEVIPSAATVSADRIGTASAYQSESSDKANSFHLDQDKVKLTKLYIIRGIEDVGSDIQSALVDLIQRRTIEGSLKKTGTHECMDSGFSVCCLLRNSSDVLCDPWVLFRRISFGEGESHGSHKYDFNLGRIASPLRDCFFATVFYSAEWSSLLCHGSRSAVTHDDPARQHSNLRDVSNLKISEVLVSTNIDRYTSKILSCLRLKASPHGSPSPYLNPQCAMKYQNSCKDHCALQEKLVIYVAQLLASMQDRDFLTVCDVQTSILHSMVHRITHILTPFSTSHHEAHHRRLLDGFETCEEALSASKHPSFALIPDSQMFESSNLDALYAIQSAYMARNSSVTPFLEEEFNEPFSYSTLPVDLTFQVSLLATTLQKVKPPV